MGSKINRRDLLVGAAVLAGAPIIVVTDGPAGAAVHHDVAIKSFTFEPQQLVVNIGDTIRWTNEDLAPHTATATDGSWDTGEIVRGDSRSIVVVEGMETAYFCAFHPHMKGAINPA